MNNMINTTLNQIQQKKHNQTTTTTTEEVDNKLNTNKIMD
jgi:hypothetical protein